MSKRKREDSSAEDTASTAQLDSLLLARQQRDVLTTFTASALHLARGFKIAKGFERQKLGRRAKTASKAKDEAEGKRIAAEIQALKTHENGAAARLHLAKSLLKRKEVVTAPALHPHIQREAATGLRDAATLNVHARLCGSGPVKEALPEAVEKVRLELGLKGEEVVKKKRLRAKDYEEMEEERQSHSHTRRKSGDDQSDSENEDPEQHEGDSDDDMVEMSDLEELERQLEAEGHTKGVSLRKQPKHDLDDFSDSDAASVASSEADAPAPRSTMISKPTKSSFLPSLTLGGYISGSGSDIDDEIDVAPRKNRRGQRARQKIWEQKFGTRAKHLQKQDRNTGWDAKRGATAASRDSGSRGRPGGRAQADVSTAQRTSRPEKKMHKDDSGPLHPSWEAAKRAKEKKAVPVAFQGKKISFD